MNAGHCREEIVSAIARQAGEMDYAPGFQLGHPLAFEAATAVAALMPAGLDRVFFTTRPESVDTALKIALAYHRARGEGQRTCRSRARLSRSGLRRHLGGRHLAQPQDLLRRPAAGGGPSAAHPQPGKERLFQGQPAWGAHLAEELERIIALHDASTIAAVIVEPMAGSTGVLVPPVGYLENCVKSPPSTASC